MKRQIELTDEEAEIVDTALRDYADKQPAQTTGVGTRRKATARDLAARIRIA